MALNRGGQGGLRVRGEPFGHASAATWWCAHAGRGKNQRTRIGCAVDEKIHGRSTGPTHLLPNNPLEEEPRGTTNRKNGSLGFRRIWCCSYFTRNTYL
jgi:hypothetical protein